jgi:hypothetical protein
MSLSSAVCSVPELPSPYYSPSLRLNHRVSDSEPAHIPRRTLAADINYHPDLSQYLRRSNAETQSQSRTTDLPLGWPQRMIGPLAWTPACFHGKREFIYELSAQEHAEIDNALKSFKREASPSSITGARRLICYVGLSLSPDHANRDTFPLVALSEKLKRVREQVYGGTGVAFLRGLETDSYTNEEIAAIYLGVSSYVAEKRGMQDQRGTMMSKPRATTVVKDSQG